MEKTIALLDKYKETLEPISGFLKISYSISLGFEILVAILCLCFIYLSIYIIKKLKLKVNNGDLKEDEFKSSKKKLICFISFFTVSFIVASAFIFLSVTTKEKEIEVALDEIHNEFIPTLMNEYLGEYKQKENTEKIIQLNEILVSFSMEKGNFYKIAYFDKEHEQIDNEVMIYTAFIDSLPNNALIPFDYDKVKKIDKIISNLKIPGNRYKFNERLFLTTDLTVKDNQSNHFEYKQLKDIDYIYNINIKENTNKKRSWDKRFSVN